jgi:hypothetical protein
MIARPASAKKLNLSEQKSKTPLKLADQVLQEKSPVAISLIGGSFEDNRNRTLPVNLTPHSKDIILRNFEKQIEEDY